MTENINVTCPKCGSAVPLTEALARPLLEAEREKLDKEAQERAAGLEARESEITREREKLAETEKNLKAQQSDIDHLVNERLRAERKTLTDEATKKAAEIYSAKLEEAETELADKDLKLREAQQAELTIRKERTALETQKRELELQVERRLDVERGKIRELTQREQEEAHRLKLADKDKIIDDMRKQVEELRRKSEQGSQQLQGEVGELQLEATLKDAFPGDRFDPVAKGRPGGDVIHTVIGPSGIVCGKILWENKRTRNWSNDWLSKNRRDQRDVGAHVGAIITLTMPKGVDAFDCLEGVWVAGTRCTLPLAKALRHALIEAGRVKVAAQGRDDKTQRMYAYLTGQQFKLRVSAIVEAYVEMRATLDVEKRATQKHWAKREQQLELLLTGTAGMYGDLQGIVGKSLAELDGLKLPSEDAMSERPLELSDASGMEDSNPTLTK